MSRHWTYESFAPDADLMQGDILEPTEELREVLRLVHPHFLDPKYTGFLLVSQSCDVVRRRGECSTKYLNLAVVRPLESVLFDLLSHVCRSVGDGVYLKESRKDALLLLQRVFNQNESALGLFYLHIDQEAGVLTESVSLLRVTVTLRADHYDIVRLARRGRLRPEFRSKLGWLVGNLYSRIGTEDWSDPPEREKELRKLVQRFMDGPELPARPCWVPKAWVDAAADRGVDIAGIPRDDVLSRLEACKPTPPRDLAIQQVVQVVSEVARLDPETLKRVRHRLGNDQVLRKAFRQLGSD